MVRTILTTTALLVMTAPILSIKNLILISAPGSGKGTLSQYLIEKHNYIQICPGDIFRNEIRAQTSLGKKIQPIVEKGDYVDEAIVCQLIADNLSHAIEQNQPFIIDGFPRSEISFEFLHQFLQDNNLMNNTYFLQFIASDNTCVNRILGRQVCTKCCKVYNTASAKPQKENCCDNCNIELTNRKADTKGIAVSRLEYFHAHIEPLLQTAAQFYQVKKIEAECSVQELHAQYDGLIEANR